MEQDRSSPRRTKLHEPYPWDRFSGGAQVEEEEAQDADWCPPLWMPVASPPPVQCSKPLPRSQTGTPPGDHTEPANSSITVAEFIERKFVPEHVALKSSAGRSYFRTILNHVLQPDRVARIFAANPGKVNPKLKAIPGWPYIDSLPLCELDTAIIQQLTGTALKQGYSTQTAAHIRNVIRVIFSHAIRSGDYTGPNPASSATIPPMTRKEAHALSLDQLKHVMDAMRYPEKEVTLLVILTELNLGEICGLQWKYLNFSNINRLVDDEVIPPRTIAVRKQNHRGEFDDVSASRRRSVRIPDILCSLLRELKTRKQFTARDDFVLVSRNGSPIHPHNVAARRLKVIGKSLAMPWLSWLVLHRTRIRLKSDFGRKLDQALEKIVVLQKPANPT